MNDAERGEKLKLFVPARAAPRPCKADERSSASKPLKAQQQPKQLLSPTRAPQGQRQSQRALGDYVDWEPQQAAKIAKAEKCFRESLAGVRSELLRQGLSEAERLSLTVELLERTKHGYARHMQALVVEELAREMDREVAMRLEIAPLGRERMQRRHDKERAFYRVQIARVREECEMALTAAAAKNNLLR